MKVEIVDTPDLTPIEYPHRKDTVESLREGYELTSNTREFIERIPPLLIHRSKEGCIYIIDGHHRARVAHELEFPLFAINVGTYSDLADLRAVADSGMMGKMKPPPARANVGMHRFAQALEALRRNHALPYGIETMDDFVRTGYLTEDERFVLQIKDVLGTILNR